MRIAESMALSEKLRILADAAKYDVACTSSGVERKGVKGAIGSAVSAGICHSFAADGRCISLLKILMTNECIFDCKYCVNRISRDTERATFTPDEICTLTMEFYKRNYIEGLFLSSGVLKNPTYTMELMYEVLYKLRTQYHFNGYIHVKGIPGAAPEVIQQIGYLTDRMSVNLELPTSEGMRRLTPQKTRKTILKPMRQIQLGIQNQKKEWPVPSHAPSFVPAGQSTQMIIGATPESDFQIVSVAEALYANYDLKRVFYSAYIPMVQDEALPALPGGPPLLRYYGFQARELLSEERPNFNIFLDPKCDWAVRHLEYFPVEVGWASYRTLLRVPGIGVKSAQRILRARKIGKLDFPALKKMGVVLKRAQYFITCNGKMMHPVRMEENYITNQLTYTEQKKNWEISNTSSYRQLSLFDDQSLTAEPAEEDGWKALSGQM